MWACSDNYEITNKLTPGSIVKAWVSSTAAFIKTVDPNHMVRASHSQSCRAGAWGWACICY